MISVQVSGHNIPVILARIKSELLKDMSPLLDIIGEKVVLPSIAKNFKEEGRPNAWAPLKERTQIERTKDGFDPEHPILQRYGELLEASTEKDGFGMMYDLEKQRLTIKNLLEKASRLHYGDPSSNLPARPFFFLQTEDYVKVEKETRKYLTKAIQKIVATEAI